MATRNPAWSRDELILALDLYFQGYAQLSASHPKVVELSQVLRAMPAYTDRPDAKRFRNPNGVYMKLGNFIRFDRPGHGLQRGGQLEEVVWKEYAPDVPRLHAVATAIRATVTAGVDGVELPEAEEEDAPEGRVLLRVHRRRECNRALVQKKKERVLAETGTLRCEVCDFNFRDTYGVLGDGFIECHHRTPLAELLPGQRTRLTDLAVVCANCHRMLHRNGKVGSVQELRSTVFGLRSQQLK